MNEPNTNPTRNPDQLRAVIHEFNSAWNSHRFERAGEFYADPFLHNGMRRDIASFHTQNINLISAFPDWHWEIEHVVAEGDLACVLYTITGTHSGVYEGIQPTGRTFRTSELAHYRITGARIVESWYLYDNADLKRQLTQP
jgi:predicted ester cyclase